MKLGISILANMACARVIIEPGMLVMLLIAGEFCMNMNGFIPGIDGMPGCGCGWNAIISIGLLLVAIGGGVNAVRDWSSA